MSCTAEKVEAQLFVDIHTLRGQIASARLAYRAAFYLGGAHLPLALPHGNALKTMVLIGFAGADAWQAFATSFEFRDGEPDPHNRWTVSVVDNLALAGGGFDLASETRHVHTLPAKIA